MTQVMDIYQPITAVYIKARNFATVRRDGVVYTFPIKRLCSMRHLFSNSQSEAAKIASGAKFLLIRTRLPITSHNLSLACQSMIQVHTWILHTFPKSGTPTVRWRRKDGVCAQVKR